MNFRFTTTTLGLLLCASASAVQFGAGVDYGFNKVEITDKDFNRFASTHKVTSNPIQLHLEARHMFKVNKDFKLSIQAEVMKSLDENLDVYQNQINLKQDYSFGVNLQPTYTFSGKTSAYMNVGVHFAPIKYTDTYRMTETKANMIGPKVGLGVSHKLAKRVSASAKYSVFMPLKETIKASDKKDQINIMHQTIGAGLQFAI